MRAHQRAPIEPLKPLFPNMKEGNQNRDRKKGEDPEERRLICLFWGITQKGAHFPQRSAEACLSPQKSNMKNRIIFISVHASCLFVYNEAMRSSSEEKRERRRKKKKKRGTKASGKRFLA